jgi:hypothetical protein
VRELLAVEVLEVSLGLERFALDVDSGVEAVAGGKEKETQSNKSTMSRGRVMRYSA